MSKFLKLFKPKHRKIENRSSSAVGFLVSDDAYDTLCVPGYTSLDKCPEVLTACRIVAETISMMTIHIYENTDQGDKRIINELSRKIDINPCPYLTRKTWIEAIVMNLLLYGRGNSLVQVTTRNALIDSLEPIPPSQVSFLQNGRGYIVTINGVIFDYDEVLHFVMNPDPNYPWRGQGITASLQEVTSLVRQGRHTERKFMESPKPSIIVKVDGLVDEFSSPQGRERLIQDYVMASDDGKPWIIPSEQFSVEQVRPFTLADLAISDSMKINKEAIAAIVGVPPFLLGIGSYSREAWNNFVNTKIKTIVTGIQQEMTKKLILNPNWYIKFNYTSLLDWDLNMIASVYGSLSDRGFVTGNEVRDKIGMSPLDGLDELRVLENYIPYEMASKQKKLIQGGDDDA